MIKRFGWIFLVLIPAGAFAGLLLAALVTYVMPKKYESVATIEVKPLSNTPPAPPRETEGEAPAWLMTEIEKMKSSTILEKVSEHLELPNRWNLPTQQVLPILNHALLIQSIRGTDLVSIRVRHTNKEDARDIAMEVAEVYQSHRKEIAKSDSARFLHELNKAVRDQEEKVEERRKVLATIVRTKGIIYRGTDSSLDPAEADGSQGTQKTIHEYHQLEQEKMQLEAQIASLAKYDGDQLMVYAAGLDSPDDTLRELYPRYLQAKRELEESKINGLNDQHPTVLAQNDQIGRMKKQLDEGVANLRAQLTAKWDLVIESLITRKKPDQAGNRLNAADYVDAKREFETDQELLQTLKLKLIGEDISSKIQSNVVEIHDFPAIAESPVSPNVTLNLVLGTVSGAMFFPWLGVPVMWLLNRRNRNPQ